MLRNHVKLMISRGQLYSAEEASHQSDERTSRQLAMQLLVHHNCKCPSMGRTASETRTLWEAHRDGDSKDDTAEAESYVDYLSLNSIRLRAFLARNGIRPSEDSPNKKKVKSVGEKPPSHVDVQKSCYKTVWRRGMKK